MTTRRETFYFVRRNGIDGRTFSTKRAAVAYVRRCARFLPNDRISLWFRDVVGQHIPVNWRAGQCTHSK